MKRIFKTLGSIVLSASILLSAFTCGTNIYATENIYNDKTDLYIYGAVVPVDDYFTPTEYTNNNFLTFYRGFTSGSVDEAIYSGIKSCSESINLEKFNLTKEELKNHYQNVVNSCPDIFYISQQYSFSQNTDKKIVSLIPEYNYTASQIKTMTSYYEEQMQTIIDKVNTDWSDVEKIVFIHDYLAQNFEYDTSYKIYDAYNFFKNKKGVCQAYTTVYAGLLNHFGIEVATASSDAMNHIWNLVKLNNAWYHVDVTWDDPVSDEFSLAHHNNLLLSDEGIKNNKHYSWTSDNTCKDTTFDNAYWKSITSPYSYSDGKWYYTLFDIAGKNSSLYETSAITQKGNSIYTLGVWSLPENENSFYQQAYSGLCSYNNKIYFNTQDTIYYYTPSTGKTTELYKPTASGKVFGLRISGQTLTYGITTDYKNVTAYTQKLEAPVQTPSQTPVQTPSQAPVQTPSQKPQTVKPGDINFDGKTDLTDVIEILKAAVGIITLDNKQTVVADVDNDNSITLNDTIIVLKTALGII